MALTTVYNKTQGFPIIVDEDKVDVYLQSGKYTTEIPKSPTPDSQEALAKIPSDVKNTPQSSSLRGTLTQQPEYGSLSSFKNLMSKMSDVVQRERPTVDQTLSPYSAAGVPITTPSGIGEVVGRDTERRLSTIQNVFQSSVDLIREQESKLEQQKQQNLDFGRQMLGVLLQQPELFSNVTAEDFESLRQGVISTELIQKISQAAQQPAATQEAEPKDFQFISPSDKFEGGIFEKTTGAFQKYGDLTKMRTDRHNNPIAAAVKNGQKNEFTNALDKAGITWTWGDAFSNDSSMVTIKILDNPIEGARAILADSAAIQNWYVNHTGKDILAQYGVQTNEEFKNLDRKAQNDIIKGIYQNEGGSGELIQEEPITFEEYLSQKEQEAGQTFTQTRRDALREEFEQMLTAKQDKSLDPFEQFTDEQIALSVIPTQLKNSDVELKRILEGVRLGLDQGKSAYEIADTLMGYKIQEPTGFSNSIRQYISIGDLSTSQIGEVARLINNGNQTTALSKVESQIMNIAQESNPDSFISEGATRIAVEKTRDLTNLIDELDQSPIGVAKGTFSEWIGKFKGKEAQRIKTDVTSIVAEMRNRLSGTAVTENEQRFLEPLIPSLNDSPQNFMIKLNKLRTSPLLELNALRSIYDLPTLNERSLLDLNERVRLYGSTELKPAASELDRSYVESLGL